MTEPPAPPTRPPARHRTGRLIVLGPPLLVLAALLAFLIFRAVAEENAAETNPSLPPAGVPPRALVLDLDGTVSAPGDAFEFALAGRVLDSQDSQTFEVALAGGRFPVRLLGVDAPRRGEPCFQDAVDRLQEILGRSDQVLLHPGPHNDNGRALLRYAFTPDTKSSIDALLIREGLAHAAREEGQLQAQLRALEATAAGAGVGCLWSSGGEGG